MVLFICPFEFVSTEMSCLMTAEQDLDLSLVNFLWVWLIMNLFWLILYHTNGSLLNWK